MDFQAAPIVCKLIALLQKINQAGQLGRLQCRHVLCLRPFKYARADLGGGIYFHHARSDCKRKHHIQVIFRFPQRISDAVCFH